ncbi:MAG: D-arginine dehydrogenase [Candidatus Poriferisodalaceae bacterium]
MNETADVVVIGGGIAGLGAAFHLSQTHEVAVIERETTLTAHSTGRSAAVFVAGLGGLAFSALSDASLAWFRSPPDGLADVPLLTPRGLLNLLAPGEEHMGETSQSNERKAAQRFLTASEVGKELSWVDTAVIAGALYQEDVEDMDVLAIHQAFVRGARAHGTRIHRSSEALEVTRTGNQFTARTPTGTVSAPVLVNAAGAWADVVAARCGARPVGLIPKRRTAFTVSTPEVHDGPMVGDAGFTFYAKPEAGEQMLLSPMDESPVEPHDVRHEEETVAMTIDRAQPWLRPKLRHVRQAWAGLRTFAPDENPVIGWDPEVEGLFWFAGQGGTGIQSAPAASETVASLVNGTGVPVGVAQHGVKIDHLSPARFNQ